MIHLTPQQASELRTAVELAAIRPEVRLAVGNLYLAVQDAIDLRRPVCAASGRCCRFDEFGHRLFVTTLELATFVHHLAPLHVPAAHGQTGCCPFQHDRLCSVHAIRPFGCRIFFCDQTAGQWQQQQYARFHQELQRLHEQLKVPYFYVEWRQALAAVSGRGSEHKQQPHALPVVSTPSVATPVIGLRSL
ncbi:MAG TPA: hypothetical protein VNL70_02640 [Tepidisphaeraceae bacterium]|nr:hypothetical protein [Tepidisphaeraceae bacterium]